MGLIHISPGETITEDYMNKIKNIVNGGHVHLSEQSEEAATDLIMEMCPDYLKINDLTGALEHLTAVMWMMNEKERQQWVQRAGSNYALRYMNFSFWYPWALDVLNVDLFQVCDFKRYPKIASIADGGIVAIDWLPRNKPVIISKKLINNSDCRKIDVQNFEKPYFIEIEEGVTSIYDKRFVFSPGLIHGHSHCYIKLPDSLRHLRLVSPTYAGERAIPFVFSPIRRDGELLSAFEMDEYEYNHLIATGVRFIGLV